MDRQVAHAPNLVVNLRVYAQDEPRMSPLVLLTCIAWNSKSAFRHLCEQHSLDLP